MYIHIIHVYKNKIIYYICEYILYKYLKHISKLSLRKNLRFLSEFLYLYIMIKNSYLITL